MSHKKVIKFASYCVLIIPALFLFYIFSSPFLPDFRFGPDIRFSSKVIDPAQTGFSREAFQFDDYNNYDDLAHVLSIIFPKGSSKDVILNQLQAGYGGLLYETIEEHSNEYLKPVEQNRHTFKEDVIVSYRRIYPLQSCVWGTGNKTDKIIFSFDKNAHLESLIIKYSCTQARGI
jgi:hypothetical protein